jgi:hypothetical protein
MTFCCAPRQSRMIGWHLTATSCHGAHFLRRTPTCPSCTPICTSCRDLIMSRTRRREVASGSRAQTTFVRIRCVQGAGALATSGEHRPQAEKWHRWARSHRLGYRLRHRDHVTGRSAAYGGSATCGSYWPRDRASMTTSAGEGGGQLWPATAFVEWLADEWRASARVDKPTELTVAA